MGSKITMARNAIGCVVSFDRIGQLRLCESMPEDPDDNRTWPKPFSGFGFGWFGHFWTFEEFPMQNVGAMQQLISTLPLDHN